MKRRSFMGTGAAGIAGLGLSGCSALGLGKVEVKQLGTPFDYETKAPIPQGVMPMGEIGKTGIRVSKFGFGSHMSREALSHPKEREWMIREAYDLGINFFDVYDKEGNTFQYEPMGRYLAPMINDVVVSITMWPFEGRTIEQELERDLRLFGRDHIDLVRLHAWKDSNDEKVIAYQSGHRWEWWESLFKLKEKGYIRAVGVPIHRRDDLKEPLAELPIDYVIMSYNFYHNWLWGREIPDEQLQTVIPELRKRNIGIVTMKPLAGDYLAIPFRNLGKNYDRTGEISVAKASLRYVINSGLNPDSTLGGMYSPYHIYEDVDAFYHPDMSGEERGLLDKIREKARVISRNFLPEHYRFLDEWAPDSYDGELYDMA